MNLAEFVIHHKTFKLFNFYKTREFDQFLKIQKAISWLLKGDSTDTLDPERKH